MSRLVIHKWHKYSPLAFKPLPFKALSITVRFGERHHLFIYKSRFRNVGFILKEK